MRVHRATGSPATGRSTTQHRPTTGPQGWRLGERPVSGETGERKWSFCWLPDLPLDAPLGRLVTLAHARWPIEQCSEDATGVPKTPPARVATGACGLDDCQGRRWEGLHRHLALVLLTYSFLVTERLRARAFPATPPPAPAGLPPWATTRPEPRPLPTFPALHRQVLLWLFEDLLRWSAATDPWLPLPIPRYRRQPRC